MFPFFFFGHCLFWTFYDYSVGQLDVVWGDLVQKPCQICRKSESSVMSACEWSSESEPRRFVGAPSKSDPFDPKRTADSQAETEDPFAKAHGFWSIFWGGKSSPNGRSKSPCLDSLVSWAKSWNCWPPETCWNLLKLWSSCPSPFLDFFSLFLDGTSHDESHAVHKDQTCWAIVRIFHFVTLIKFISKIYFYLIFFEICDILLWLSLRFNGKRQKMLKTLQVSKLAPCHVDKAGHRLPACAWQYLQKMAMYISQLHGWMVKKHMWFEISYIGIWKQHADLVKAHWSQVAELIFPPAKNPEPNSHRFFFGNKKAHIFRRSQVDHPNFWNQVYKLQTERDIYEWYGLSPLDSSDVAKKWGGNFGRWWFCSMLWVLVETECQKVFFLPRLDAKNFKITSGHMLGMREGYLDLQWQVMIDCALILWMLLWMLLFIGPIQCLRFSENGWAVVGDGGQMSSHQNPDHLLHI